MHNYDDRRARRTCDHHSDETLLQSELRTFGKPFGTSMGNSKSKTVSGKM